MPGEVTGAVTVERPRATVWATVDLPGFHHWPAATDRRAYLADRHRHLFWVRAEVTVSHTDRDVEFHDLGDLLRRWWGADTRDWGASSCEDIAMSLWRHLLDAGLYPTEVTVSEDGEYGATLRASREDPGELHDQ
ncbi:hypothetical protein [Pseudonocardia acaciae]|uniref:hypothetical protein n=1 Tax=Pseudonocardia acaciae TaxID=551276 RepID=UPI00048BF2A7|nr:hypothetical protein [Pseudonocardia acaciae]